MRNNIHVVHSKGEWKVKKEGSMRATRAFTTKSAAINFGRALGKQQQGEVYIHNVDGRIDRHHSYKRESIPVAQKRNS